MTPLRPRLALLLVPLAIAACGGSSTSAAPSRSAHTDPLHVVLLSAHKVSSTSYRMSMSLTEHLTYPGVLASSGAPTDFTMDGAGEAASPQRLSLTVNIAYGATSIPMLEVVFDGVAYTSLDNGASWKTLPINTGALSSSGPQQALDMLENVSTVTDTGPSTVNGQPVETYHGVINSAKMQAMMEKTFAGAFGSSSQLGTAMSAVASGIAIKQGAIDLAVSSAGLPVRETTNIDATFDLSRLASALGSSGVSSSQLTGTMELSMSGTFTFSDFGKPVTVTKPTNVVGTFGV